ncbi:CoA-binding protein [Alicyclobacillus sp. SO9]|uniref:CoA-binding protein n=1 Tax=Alicyclobacillus sp. SO9 TaxID=2665646 RepID=UPI0018E6DD4E|nr:CoA-binding protein [Alicyclobacillus sp. SO9]QQE80667.1 CoA-binding protein [Alicyclobacillus sp. SO9]
MFENPSNDEIKAILKQAKSIAVVGLSDNPDRESYAVAQEMQRRGYRIVPVNPKVDSVLGMQAYASVQDIPFAVDIVDVFRRSEALTSVVKDVLKTSAPVIWAQQGVFDEDAAQLANDNRRTMIMDRCIMVMHSLLVKSEQSR